MYPLLPLLPARRFWADARTGTELVSYANDLPQVVEAHRVTGEDCFIIKAYIKALENLDQLLDRF